MGKTTPRTETDSAMVEAAVALRQRLHRRPEVAGEESETANEIVSFLGQHGLEPIAENIAGSGLLYRIEGKEPGPARLFRADLDALPLHEGSGQDHASEVEGRHHACGHDGHMAMLAGALAEIASSDGLKGTLYGLFQPAEETGMGGEEVLKDPRVNDLGLDAVFALHNLPGHPLGALVLREGPMAVTSVGLHYRFTGTTSHAGAPQEGRNPIALISQLVLRAMATPQVTNDFRRSTLVTPIHVDAGQPAFGTSAGAGSVRFTVRADSERVLESIVARIDDLAASAANAEGFELETERVDPFPVTVNAPEAVGAMRRAAEDANLSLYTPEWPMPWSEDFGHLSKRWPGALAGIGAGEDRPDLHTPQYDFPDELVQLGIRFWKALALGGRS